MLPQFNRSGNLPTGIHEATLVEIEGRFATNVIRKIHFQYLKLLISDLKMIGCKTIYIDGSYVTRKIHPKDVDVCWVTKDVDLYYAKLKMPILWDFSNYGRKAQQLKYHADVFPADAFEASTGLLFIDFFQLDKNTGAAKGIIKLEI